MPLPILILKKKKKKLKLTLKEVPNVPFSSRTFEEALPLRNT